MADSPSDAAPNVRPDTSIGDLLPEGELLYRILAEHSTDVIFVQTSDGRFRYASPATRRLLGHAPDELVGRSAYDFVHPDDRNAVQEVHDRVLRSPVSGTVECRMRQQDGRYTWFETTAQSVRDPDTGAVREIVAVSHDISERRRAEQALRDTEAKLMALFDAEVIGIAMGEEEWITQANEAFLGTMGYTREDLPLDWTQMTPPELREESAERVRDTIETGRCTPFEKELFHREGSRVPAIVGGYCLGTDPFRYVGFILDITERKRAEDELRRSEQRFRTVTDTLPQVVWTARPDGAIDYFNQRWTDFTRRPVEEGLGWAWRRFIHPDDDQRTVDSWAHAVRTGEPYRMEHRVYWADGTFRWHLSQARPLRDEEGRIVRWFGTGTDIEAQKRAEEAERRARREAEAASRAKNEFLATMSHELRTPLNAIIGYQALLEGEFAGPLNLAQRRHLQRIRGSSWHLLELIDEILALARIEAGEEEARPERVNAVALAGDAAERIRPLAAKKGLALTMSVPGRLLPLHTDPGKLRQILVNLLSNAVKFTLNGEVELRVWAEEGSVCFAVRDTGVGIAPEHRDTIWEPFTQVDQSTTRQEGGTGLGLPLSRRLAGLLGGEIVVASESGAGSTFTLRLPAGSPALLAPS